MKMDATKIISFTAMALATNLTWAQSCFDLKNRFIETTESRILERCKQLSGKKIHPEKRKLVQRVVRDGWDGKATVECANRCAKSTDCVTRYSDSLIDGALKQIIPKITAEWCTSGV